MSDLWEVITLLRQHDDTVESFAGRSGCADGLRLPIVEPLNPGAVACNSRLYRIPGVQVAGVLHVIHPVRG